MEINDVLEFTKTAIQKNLARAYVWDEVVLLQAFDMIEAYQNQPSNNTVADRCSCGKPERSGQIRSYHICFNCHRHI